MDTMGFGRFSVGVWDFLFVFNTSGKGASSSSSHRAAFRIGSCTRIGHGPLVGHWISVVTYTSGLGSFWEKISLEFGYRFGIFGCLIPSVQIDSDVFIISNLWFHSSNCSVFVEKICDVFLLLLKVRITDS
jgi:hypothetical protein